MSLYGALRSGVSALQAQTQAMAMVSNNISNLNTNGYKRTAASFSTLVSGANNETTFSGGSVISRPNLKATAVGQITKSSSNTDLSINGQGFFAVAKSSDTVFNGTTGKYQNNGEVLYTRLGDFSKNKNGLLENSAGYILLSWPRNSADTGYDQTNLPGQLSPVTISDTTGTPKSTTSININANLSSDSQTASNFSATVDVFDLQGTSHVMKVNFARSLTIARAYDVSVEMLDTKAAVITGYNNVNAEGTQSTLMSALHSMQNGVQKVNFQYDTPLKTPTATQLSELRSAYLVQYQDINGETKNITVDKVAIDGGRVELDLNEVLPTDNADGTASYSHLRVLFDASKVSAGNTLEGTVVNATGEITTPVEYSPIPGFGYNLVGTVSNSNVAAGAATLPNGDAPVVGRVIFVGGNARQITSVERDVATGAITDYKYDEMASSQTPAAPAVLTFPATEPLAQGDQFTVIDPNDNTQLLLQEVELIAADPAASPPIPANAYRLNQVAVEAGSPLASSVSLGQIQFAEDGTIFPGNIKAAGAGINKINSLNSTSSGFSIKFDFAGDGVTQNVNGKTDDVTANLNFAAQSGNTGMTSYSSPHAIYSIDQNGSTAGSFKFVQVNTVGEVEAAFSVGDNRKLAQVPIVMFSSANSLQQVDGNAFRGTNNSGTVIIRRPGSAGAGLITSATLESSNVDLATEFTDMIVTQRAYSASTKIITTADEMLEELVRAKR